MASTAMRNLLVDAYKAAATHGAAYTSAPTQSAAGTEVTGGSYARKPVAWGATSNGSATGTCTYDIPSGQTVAGLGLHSAITAGIYYDGTTVPSQPFSSNGTYAASYVYNQTG